MRKLFSILVLQIAITVIIGISVFLPSYLHAQDSPVSFRLSAGTAHLSVNEDWPHNIIDYNNGQSKKRFTRNRFFAIDIGYSITKNQDVRFGVNYISTMAQFLKIEESPRSVFTDEYQWNFLSIPFMLGYERRFTSFNRYFTPFIGFGMTYVIGIVNPRESNSKYSKYSNNHIFASVDGTVTISQYPRSSNSTHGTYLNLGFETQITDKLSIVFQARYRDIDAIPLVLNNVRTVLNDNEFVQIDFSGYDIGTGLRFSLSK